MGTILLQTSLDPHSVALLRKEFPQYRLLYYQFASIQTSVSKGIDWSKVEIFYGNRFTSDQLLKADGLHWIHNPTPSFSRISLNEALERGNIIVTAAGDENVGPIGEFVMGAILNFSKHFFHWHDLMKTPNAVWDSTWRDSLWTLPEHTMLQIGLGQVGTEIARCAKQFGLEVWGMQEKRSFHPYCDKTFSLRELHTVLPAVDIVSIALPRDRPYPELFTKLELEMMKNDSILVVIGAHNVINEQALVSVGSKGKFRGILLDTLYSPSISPSSPLWHVPHLLITPEIAARPRPSAKKGFHTFYYNLRQYSIGNFADMRNRLDTISK